MLFSYRGTARLGLSTGYGCSDRDSVVTVDEMNTGKEVECYEQNSSG
jgi:hypothetical protein